MSFEHLKKLQPSATDTIEYVFYDIDGEPTINVLPATEANKSYHNALLRKNAKNARRLRAGKLTPQMLSETRNDDRELYARYVAKSWTGILHSDGTEATFTAAECLAFFEALPNWVFDDLRMFCADPVNFLDDAVSHDEAADTAGN